MNAIIWSS